jgi:hypothetical protein
MRATNIRRTILDVLERAQPYALPESQLIVELNGAMRPAVSTAEFDDQLLFLQIRRYVTTVPDPLDDQLIKWAITEAGLTMLRQ